MCKPSIKISKPFICFVLFFTFSSAVSFSQMYIVNEDFNTASGTTPPTGWNNITIVGDPEIDLWHFNNPGGQTIQYPITPPFAIFDAGAYSDNNQPEVVALESRSFDASVSTHTLLLFDHTFVPAYGAVAKLTAFDGEDWVLVMQWDLETLNPASEIIDISSYVGGVTNARLRFTWDGNGGGFWAIDNIRILAPLALDGGLTRLNSPAIPFNEGNQPVKVTLANFGIQNITSTTINWRINGEDQPAYNWSGNLSFGQAEENIELGNYDFNEPTLLEIWQSMPNGQQDLNPSNDSIITIARPAMCGEYTIGGPDGDFASFTEAINALNLAGVNCPVVFKVRDGEYQEQILIRKIAGTSEANTVTFESESSDSTAVTIRFDESNSADVRFVRAQYIVFNQIGFHGNINMEIDNHSESINITNCQFTTGNISIRVRSGSNNINIFSNDFIGGGHGIHVFQDDGVISATPNNVNIFGNTFSNFHWDAIHIDLNNSTGNIIIAGNDFYAGVTPLRINRSIRIIVRDNQILIGEHSQSHNRGLEINNSDSISVYNNFIRSSGLHNTNLIYMDNVHNSGIYFNSLSIGDIGAEVRNMGLRLNGGNNNQIKNNIFSINKAGYPIYINPGTSGFTLDHNNYYTPQGIIGNFNDTAYYDLQDWITATGQDNNSLSEYPFYTSDSDLSINQVLLTNAAMPIDGIDYDIDGVLRDPNAPDIGAKEYDPCQPDAGINRVSAPLSPVPSGMNEVKVILQNQGSGILTSATINWEVNGQMQTPFDWTGNLEHKENLEVGIGDFDFEGGLYDLRVWTSQPNGQNDCNAYNDTISETIASILCGEYTIGGSDGDFANFTEAVSALHLAGVNCPVVFKVRDGEYQEQIFIGEISGASEVNTITFESESNDSTAVTIRYDASSSTDFRLVKTSHLIFNQIGFYGTRILEIDNFSHSINIINCLLIQIHDGFSIRIRSGSNNINFANTNFIGASTGITIYGHDGIISETPSNIHIVGNKFSNFGSQAINLNLNNQAGDITIAGNDISARITPVQVHNSKRIEIRDNRIDPYGAINRDNFGLVITNSDSISIYNNFVYSSGLNKTTSIYAENIHNSGIYFNSLNIGDIGAEVRNMGLRLNGGNNNQIKNNIFSINKAGYPIYINPGTSGFTLDHNNYYTPQGIIGNFNDTAYYDLEDWITATGQDNNSLTTYPFYTSESDLSINQVLLTNAAMPIDGIDYDIDGVLRDPNAPDIGAKEYDPCQPDAGINRVTAPVSPVPSGINEVKAILQNQGSGILTSATINWEVNGQLQTPFDWTGSLEHKENSEVGIGGFDFEGGLYDLRAWTSQPNGQNDCNAYNDTISETIASILCGEYTIGGSDGDFANFTEAVSALHLAGVNCPVVFKVRDGEYQEQIFIGEISGASEFNTITFESESNDSTAVQIIYHQADQAVVNLINTESIKLKKITVNGVLGILVDNESNNIIISNCYFAGGSWGIGIRSGSNSIDITNNLFIGSRHGVLISHHDGINWKQPYDIFIHNNSFQNTDRSALFIDWANNITFSDNVIDAKRSGVFAHHVNNITVKNNRMFLESIQDWHNTGVLLEHSDTSMVYNNYIYTDGIFPSYGIRLHHSSNNNIYYNSVQIANTDFAEESRAFWLHEGGHNTLRNNIFSTKYQGHPIFISTNTHNFSLDFNNYYNPNELIGHYEGNDYHDLSLWGSTINGDANSKNVNPRFAATDNPLPYQRDLNGAGIPIPGILLDINGLIRNDAAPDIGCVEFFVDFGVTDLLSPTLDCFQTDIEDVTVLLRQFGDIPFQDLFLAYQVNEGPVKFGMIPGTIYNDLEFTFDATVDMSEDGEYHFKVWLINALDDNVNNDTLWTTRYSKPSPVVSIDHEIGCEGLQFYGNATVPDPYFITDYQWDFGDGTQSSEQNPFHIFPDTLNYLVTFKAYSDAGCYSKTEEMINVPVDVIPLPVSVEIFASDNNICQGVEITYTAVPENPGSDPSYQWQVNGNEAGSDAAVFSYEPADGDVVRVILTSSEFCTTGSPALSNEITMNVTPSLPVSVEIQVSDNDLCESTMVDFTALPVNEGNNPSYQWQVNGEDRGPDNAVYAYEPADGDVVRVILTSSENCTTGNPATSNEIVMNVHPVYEVSVTIEASNDDICEGEEVQFTAIPHNPGSVPVYQWQVNGADFGPNNPVFIYEPSDGDKVRVILTSSEICTTGSPAASNEISMIVSPVLPVGVDIDASDPYVCVGQPILFTAIPVNEGDSPLFEWFVNGVLFDDQSGEMEYFPDDEDEVFVILTSSERCTTGNPAVSDTIVVDVFRTEISNNEVMNPGGDGDNDYFVVKTTCAIDLLVEIYDRRGRMVYSYNDIDGYWDGNYSNGSEAPDGIYNYLIDAIGFDEIKHSKSGLLRLVREKIELKPNPAKNEIHVDTKGRLTGNIDVKIYDYQGKLIHTTSHVLFDNKFSIDLSMLNDGFYIIVFSDSYNAFSKKLIINKQ